MNDENLSKLRESSSVSLRNLINNKEIDASSVVDLQIDNMLKEGKIIRLSDEEERMLKSFRNFKKQVRKNGEVFKWQTSLDPPAETV